MDKFLTFPGLLLPLLGLALLASCGADARGAKETPLLTRALPDVPGREVLIETVVLAPGKVVPAHRHYSDAAVAIDAEVDLRLTNGAFSLPRLNVSLPGLERNVAQTLVDAAHETCPYSKPRGNID
jgi:hypothetical protein